MSSVHFQFTWMVSSADVSDFWLIRDADATVQAIGDLTRSKMLEKWERSGWLWARKASKDLDFSSDIAVNL